MIHDGDVHFGIQDQKPMYAPASIVNSVCMCCLRRVESTGGCATCANRKWDGRGRLIECSCGNGSPLTSSTQP